MKMQFEIVGKLKVNRADKNEIECKCCRPLPHAYSYWIAIKPRKSRYAGLVCDSLTDWLHERLGDWVGEGSDTAKARVTVELYDEPTPPPSAPTPRSVRRGPMDNRERAVQLAEAINWADNKTDAEAEIEDALNAAEKRGMERNAAEMRRLQAIERAAKKLFDGANIHKPTPSSVTYSFQFMERNLWELSAALSAQGEEK